MVKFIEKARRKDWENKKARRAKLREEDYSYFMNKFYEKIKMKGEGKIKKVTWEKIKRGEQN